MSKQLANVYRGIVKNILDPQRMGRVQVYIPTLHGAGGNALDITQLPWATPGIFLLGMDSGTFDIPQVESNVFLLFEDGNADKPVYIGNAPRQQKDARIVVSPPESTTDIDNRQIFSLSEGGAYYGNDESDYNNEIISEVFKHNIESDLFPYIKVLLKTLKGFTIMYDERDEHENLSIIDRVGNIIKFNCPVTKLANINNSSRRGERRADEETGTSLQNILNGETSVELNLVGGSKLKYFDGLHGNGITYSSSCVPEHKSDVKTYYSTDYTEDGEIPDEVEEELKNQEEKEDLGPGGSVNFQLETGITNTCNLTWTSGDKTLGINIDADNGSVIFDINGTEKLSFDTGNLTIQVSGDANIKANNVSLDASNVNLNSSNMAISSDVSITGSLKVNGINFDTHTHGNVQSGSSKTGPPE